ncbi:MAG TPA: right-handed parallel beta-helix repeat-containing protein [Sedimentisphaerales bacterium]|nr:right-handed parallel beta-helix repeat-containing protein [Sedimentisphaerales bacterium]
MQIGREGLLRTRIFALGLLIATAACGAEFYVATNGRDTNPGTREKPFATLARAQQAVRELDKKSAGRVSVFVREGTYYLKGPLTFGPGDGDTVERPVRYAAYENEVVTLSGGRRLDCKWTRHKGRIMKCELPDVKQGRRGFGQLFVNGRRQHRARFPNYDDSRPGQSGYIRPEGKIPENVRDPNPDENEDMTHNNVPPRGIVFDPATFTKRQWARPEEAVIHIFQAPHWGNLQWTVKGIDYDEHYLWFGKGGQQIGATFARNPTRVDGTSQFYVENVFEELDAPGEWYLDAERGVLYYWPAEDVDLDSALVEAAVLEQVIRFVGDQYEPVRNITLEGFRIAHTASTFLEEYSIPSGSDWSIHRGGAIFLEGARNCTIKDCWFDAVGGNGVFMNNFNRDNVVTGCKFTETGDSAICFVGTLEFTNGTFRSFPYECRAVNNLIHDCGVFGKQIAGVYISRAKRITASHNLIYNMPRAGICIGDGTWGGHVIEFNHIYDCVRETQDHGPFNSWGREGYWCLTQSHSERSFTWPHPAGDVKIWAQEPTVVRNNFLHGISGYEGGYRQGLDFDDGTSNYHIYSNVCKNMAISIREGDYRTVENNIIIKPVVPFGIHVGYTDNHDVIRRNIIVTDGDIYYMNDAPPQHPYLSEVNNNLFYHPSPGWGDRTVITVRPRGKGLEKYTLGEWRQLGYDKDSAVKDPLFVDSENDDYRVREESPALKLGFRNFDMNWGLTDDFPEKWLP